MQRYHTPTPLAPGSRDGGRSPISLLAYIALPALWSHHEHEPGLASLPMVTRTSTGIPGDALNVGLVGREEDILRAMQAAGWFPADPVTLRTSIDIVGSVVLDRPYHEAPVSPLFYEGKKEQLAFEKPDGTSADRRHHVRLWLVLEKRRGRPPGLARRRDIRSRGWPEPLHRAGHPSHRPKHRRRARPVDAGFE